MVADVVFSLFASLSFGNVMLLVLTLSLTGLWMLLLLVPRPWLDGGEGRYPYRGVGQHGGTARRGFARFREFAPLHARARRQGAESCTIVFAVGARWGACAPDPDIDKGAGRHGERSSNTGETRRPGTGAATQGEACVCRVARRTSRGSAPV